MSMSLPHMPFSDPNAQAKSMIDAVTGHQPSPLDSDIIGNASRAETEDSARKTSNLVGWKTSSHARRQASSGRISRKARPRRKLLASCPRAL